MLYEIHDSLSSCRGVFLHNFVNIILRFLVYTFDNPEEFYKCENEVTMLIFCSLNLDASTLEVFRGDLILNLVCL